MLPSSTAELLDVLQRNDLRRDIRPWGVMECFDSPEHDLTIKHITVHAGRRTSLQYHEHKDELLIVLSGFGHVTLDSKIQSVHDGRCMRVAPGVRHRVTGPLEYLEISTYDDDTDTIRLEDDHGRSTRGEPS